MTIENLLAQIKPDIVLLLQTLEEISRVRVRLDRTLLSRHRYISMRYYTEKILMRIKNHKHEHQPKITQFFSVQIPRTTEDSEPELKSYQFEDYRGESD